MFLQLFLFSFNWKRTTFLLSFPLHPFLFYLTLQTYVESIKERGSEISPFANIYIYIYMFFLFPPFTEIGMVFFFVFLHVRFE